MMRGPTTESRRFVTDASGRQTAVIVPIDAYELLVANVTDLAVAIGDCRCLILGSAAIVPGEHTRFVCKHPETGTAGQRRLIARAEGPRRDTGPVFRGAAAPAPAIVRASGLVWGRLVLHRSEMEGHRDAGRRL